MEKIKKELVELLVENARYSAKELAKILGATEEEIAVAMQDLEKEGVIVKYAAIVNTEKVDAKKVQALIEVKVAPQKLKGFDSYAEQLYTFAEVRSLYLMSGGFDLAIFIDGESITDIARFVSEKLSVIDGINGVQTHFILKTYKLEGQVTVVAEDNRRQIIQAWEIF